MEWNAPKQTKKKSADETIPLPGRLLPFSLCFTVRWLRPRGKAAPHGPPVHGGVAHRVRPQGSIERRWRAKTAARRGAVLHAAGDHQCAAGRHLACGRRAASRGSGKRRRRRYSGLRAQFRASGGWRGCMPQQHQAASCRGEQAKDSNERQAMHLGASIQRPAALIWWPRFRFAGRSRQGRGRGGQGRRPAVVRGRGCCCLIPLTDGSHQ